MNLQNFSRSAYTPSEAPSTIFQRSLRDSFKANVDNTLSENSVTFASEQFRSAYETGIDRLYSSLYTKLHSQVERNLLAEQISQNQSDITDSQAEIQTRLEQELSQRAMYIARSISNNLNANSHVLNTQGQESNVISAENIRQVLLLLSSLSYTLHDSNFTDLVQSVSLNSTQIEQPVLVELFDRISSLTTGSSLNSIQQLTTSYLNSPNLNMDTSQNPLLYSLASLQVLSFRQKEILADYAISQIETNPSKAEIVLTELCLTGSLPISVLEAKITSFASTQTNSAVYAEILNNIISAKAASNQMYIAAENNLQTAINIAGSSGGDITNPALNGGTWLKLFGYLYGLLATSVNFGAGVLSGDPAGAVAAALPWAGLSALTFQHKPLDSFGQISRRLQFNEQGREQINKNLVRDSLSKLTIYSSTENLLLFSSNEFIQKLVSNTNYESDPVTFNLNKFEDELKANPETYARYTQYSAEFRGNRNYLIQNLIAISNGYSDLEINDRYSFVSELGRYYGISQETLTTLS